MQRLLLLITTALVLAAPASAEHVYGGLARDNPELQEGHVQEQATMATESETSSEIRVYHGLAKQNPDLVGKREPSGPTGKNPEIYEGFEPNPSLSY